MSTEDTRQRPVHRHAQDAPSLAELVAALERGTNAAFQRSADYLKLAEDTRRLLAALRLLSGLADALDNEAALNGESASLFTAGIAKGYEMAAARLRNALAEGVPG